LRAFPHSRCAGSHSQLEFFRQTIDQKVAAQGVLETEA
jgi:hypothetical protein